MCAISHVLPAPSAAVNTRLLPTGPYKGSEVEGPEYENIFALGAMCENDSIETVAAAERLCDDLGMDAVETGVSIAFSMEAREKGLLTEKDIDGLDLSFGNRAVIMPMVRKIGLREGIGDLLADGVKRAADKIGGGAADFAMQNKGMSLSRPFRARAFQALRLGMPPDRGAHPIMTRGQRASAQALCRGKPLKVNRSTLSTSIILTSLRTR